MFAPTESFANLDDQEEQAIAQLNLMACKLVRKGQVDEGVALLRRARHTCVRDKELFKDQNHRKMLHATTLNNLGCAVIKTQAGRIENALEYFAKALKLEKSLPQNQPSRNPAGTHLNVCAMLSKLKRHKEARHHAQCALSLLRDGKSPAITTDGAGQTSSVLALAHHNLAVEQEYLKEDIKSLHSYMAACEACLGTLGKGHKLTQAIYKNASAALTSIEKRLRTVPEKKLAQQALNKTQEVMGGTRFNSVSSSGSSRTTTVFSSSTSSNDTSLLHNTIPEDGFSLSCSEASLSSLSSSNSAGAVPTPATALHHPRDVNGGSESEEPRVVERTNRQSRTKTVFLVDHTHRKATKPTKNMRGKNNRLERGHNIPRKTRELPRNNRSDTRGKKSGDGGVARRPLHGKEMLGSQMKIGGTIVSRKKAPVARVAGKRKTKRPSSAPMYRLSKDSAAHATVRRTDNPSMATGLFGFQQTRNRHAAESGVIFRPPSLEQYKRIRPKSALHERSNRTNPIVVAKNPAEPTRHVWGGSVANSTAPARKIAVMQQSTPMYDLMGEENFHPNRVGTDPVYSSCMGGYLDFLTGHVDSSIGDKQTSPRRQEINLTLKEAEEERDRKNVAHPCQRQRIEKEAASIIRRQREDQQAKRDLAQTRMHEKEDAQRLTQTVVKVQCFTRTFIAKKKSAEMRLAIKRQQAAKEEARLSAIVKIQSQGRGFIARKEKYRRRLEIQQNHILTVAASKNTSLSLQKSSSTRSLIGRLWGTGRRLIKTRQEKARLRAEEKRYRDQLAALEKAEQAVRRIECQAATRIQASCRRFLATHRMLQLKVISQRTCHAAIRIQAKRRQIIARRIVASRARELCLQQRRHLCAAQIQAHCRRMLASKRRNRLRKARDTSAATKLQAFWRGKSCKLAYQTMAKARIDRANRAALSLQKYTRRFLVCKWYVKRLASIIKIQSHGRQLLATRIYQEKQRAHVAARHGAALAIQKHWRRVIAQAKTAKIVRMLAITTLQAYTRGFLGRRFAMRRRRCHKAGAALLVQRYARRLLAVKKRRRLMLAKEKTVAATRIQSGWRRRVAAQKVKQLIQAHKKRQAALQKYIDNVVCIQSIVRRHFARYSYHLKKRELSASICIQAATRRYLAQLQAFLKRKACHGAIALQKIFRGHQGRALHSRLLVEGKAATVIEAAARCYLQQCCFHTVRTNIVHAQACARMWLAKRVLESKKDERDRLVMEMVKIQYDQSVLAVQSWWRGYLVRKMYPDVINKMVATKATALISEDKSTASNQTTINHDKNEVALFAIGIIDAIREAEAVVRGIECSTLGVTVPKKELWRELVKYVRMGEEEEPQKK